MIAFELPQIADESLRGDVVYHEFLHVPAMSAGLYRLAAGSTDPQHPHSEDEIYHVLAGSGQIRVADQDRPVRAGSFVYVPAHVEHRFHSIQEELLVLVLFAPSEGSQRTDEE